MVVQESGAVNEVLRPAIEILARAARKSVVNFAGSCRENAAIRRASLDRMKARGNSAGAGRGSLTESGSCGQANCDFPELFVPNESGISEGGTNDFAYGYLEICGGVPAARRLCGPVK